MLHCAILGDSLAQGVAILRPDCLSDTKVGISSASYMAGHIVKRCPAPTRWSGQNVSA